MTKPQSNGWNAARTAGQCIDVWRLIDGEWKPARVISYDRRLAE